MSTIKPVRLEMPKIDENKDVSEYNEIEKMVSGMLYKAFEEPLVNGRAFGAMECQRYNRTSRLELALRTEILQGLLGTWSKGVYIEPPFYCDFGTNIHLGENVYMNYNCIILDICEVRIGANTQLAPNVQLYAATHPTDPIARRISELGKRIVIGRDCWIGGGAIICPGVTIGDGSTVGAGSVVTKDVEPFVVVAGNPAKVIKRLEKRDLDAHVPNSYYQ